MWPEGKLRFNPGGGYWPTNIRGVPLESLKCYPVPESISRK